MLQSRCTVKCPMFPGGRNRSGVTCGGLLPPPFSLPSQALPPLGSLQDPHHPLQPWGSAESRWVAELRRHGRNSVSPAT